MLHQQDQTLSKSLLTVRQALKELLGILEFSQRTCLVTLKCQQNLVIIDLKIGKFTHADAGQMHLYLNYAREHWTHSGENPPVGLILCAEKDAAVAHYALEGLPNKVLAAEYRTTLPDEETMAAEVEHMRKMLVGHVSPGRKQKKG